VLARLNSSERPLHGGVMSLSLRRFHLTLPRLTTDVDTDDCSRWL